jgi:hypothetical protein
MVYVCMHVCVCVCVFVCMHVDTYVCMHVCVYSAASYLYQNGDVGDGIRREHGFGLDRRYS